MIGITAPPAGQGFAASDAIGAQALNKAMESLNNPGNNQDHYASVSAKSESVETENRAQDYQTALLDYGSMGTSYDTVKNMDAVMHEGAGAIVNMWT